jgi:CheY-like chemotaxis protein
MNPQALILIVDDDAELGGMLVELLSREGWRTHQVLTGADGAGPWPSCSPRWCCWT